MAKRSTEVAGLAKQLKQRVPVKPVQPKKPDPKPAQTKQEPVPKPPTTTKLQGVSFSLRPAVDLRKIKDLKFWLIAQGENPTDSTIVKSALALAQSNQAFLEAHRQVRQSDRRRKKVKR